MFQHLFINLLLHGEGGDGAGAATGAEATGAEGAGVTAPVAGEKNRRLSKEERRARLEEKLRAEQAQIQQAQPQPQSERQPFEEIEKLYSEEIGQKIQKAVTGRVKNLKDSEAELNAAREEIARLEKLLTPLAEAQYGIKPGQDGKSDIDAIEQATQRTRVQDYALENGVSEEFAEQRLHMEDELAEKDRQLREYQAAEEARKRDQEQYAQFQKHRAQAEVFRQKVPGFDLVQEMERTPLFAQLLSFGVPVENAYYAAHHEELMAAGQQAAAMQAQRAISTSIQAGQSMPAEGGLGRSPAASPQRVTNPRQWTKAERAEIRRRVQRGEDIYL